MSTTETKPVATTPAKPESANPTVRVGNMVSSFLNKGTLHLPSDYSPENALKSAWLLLQTVQDRDQKPALQVCTQESIVNALLDMVVQGLNPAKKQCYFIVYGKNLTCQRSYFGDQALAERVMPGIEIYSSIIYKGDTFEYEKVRGRTVVTKHTTGLDNQKAENIIGAYCGVVDLKTGEDLGAEVMTIEQIKKSWGMSKTYNPNGKGTHHEFPDQMALRTVIRRRCKPIINSASDALLLESIRRQELDSAEDEINEDVALNANGEMLALNAPPQEQMPAATAAPETVEVQDEDDKNRIGKAPKDDPQPPLEGGPNF